MNTGNVNVNVTHVKTKIEPYRVAVEHIVTGNVSTGTGTGTGILITGNVNATGTGNKQSLR